MSKRNNTIHELTESVSALEKRIVELEKTNAQNKTHNDLLHIISILIGNAQKEASSCSPVPVKEEHKENNVSQSNTEPKQAHLPSLDLRRLFTTT